jgi:hypothetical protein
MSNRILYIPKEKKYVSKKKISHTLWVIGGMALCAVLITVSIMTVRLHAFHIQHIPINGLRSIHGSDVQQEISSVLTGSYAFGLIPYGSLFTTPTQTIIDAIMRRFPLITEVHIEKEFPDTLTISVRERIMFGILCNDLAHNDLVDQEVLPEEDTNVQCVYVDTEGIAYESAPKTHGFLITKISTDAPVIALVKQAVDPLMMQRITDLNTKLPSVIGSPIVEYQLVGNVAREVRVVSKIGFSLIINRDDDLDHALSVLGTILKKEIGSRRKNLDYIDLRFGNKVFYKFK